MEPKISLIMSGNLYMRQMRFENKGDIEKGHCHTYDHLTLLATGSMKVKVDGTETVFVAPTAIKILAGKIHELEALEDNTLAYCVHALREAMTEEVLPPQAQITDRKTKSFVHTEDKVLVKPNITAVEVDGQEVDLAPIASLDKATIGQQHFNRNLDDKPLVVKMPDGSDEGVSYV